MINLRRYKLLKSLTIFLGAVSIPLGTYAGFCFGTGDSLKAWGLTALLTTLVSIDNFIYWYLIEAQRVQPSKKAPRISNKGHDFLGE